MSATSQSAALVVYEVTRPVPKPQLTIRLDDSAASWDYDVGRQTAATRAIAVTVPKDFQLAIDERPAQSGERVALPAGDVPVQVRVTAPDGTVWTKRVDVAHDQGADVDVTYTPSRGSVLVTRVGDAAPLARCTQARCTVSVEPGTKLELSALVGEDATFGGYHQYPMRTPPALVPILGDPLASCIVTDADVTSGRDVRDCSIVVKADTDVAVEFGLQPKRVDVAFTDPQNLSKILRPITPPAPAIDAEKLEEPVVLAIKPPPPPKLMPPPPPPPPDQPKPPPQPPKQPPPNMVMVEVKDDKHVVKEAPKDATKLSDKDRDVAEEMRATKTNLDKESEGKTDASRESDDKTSAEIGGPQDRIRQLEETKATTDKHIQETDHSGQKEVAKGAIQGEGGDNGENGTGGIMSMRGIGGRGSITEQGDGKKAGKKGLPGINTPMAQNDYERIVGKDKADNEREVAARKMSSKKGRWERKLDAIKSSLENFVPDVRPGNQTALKTRAHPYALYIARMHRRIHELWGFGFLEDLESKPADYPLNDFNLWVNLEISVNPDGTVHKVTIAKTSGKTEFDVAAVDTVISAGPYEPTPEAIRSVDGRIYLRWGFYRNWRQCGTFNVEPYILTSVPEDSGQGVLDDGAMVKNTAHLPGGKRGRHDHIPTGDKTVTPDDGMGKQKAEPESSVTDKEALFAANQFVSAFATAEVDKLVKYSTVPFYANGKVAAQTAADLKDMFGGLVVESGPMKDWKLLSTEEYAPGSNMPPGNVVLRVTTTKESFAVVLTKTKSGEYRATQLAR
ncbi:MAG TPA: TonB family protein [Kofleriaceae bacterium]|nr:TonB family protein [Kofleriaceae bacterium]